MQLLLWSAAFKCLRLPCRVICLELGPCNGLISKVVSVVTRTLLLAVMTLQGSCGRYRAAVSAALEFTYRISILCQQKRLASPLHPGSQASRKTPEHVLLIVSVSRNVRYGGTHDSIIANSWQASQVHGGHRLLRCDGSECTGQQEVRIARTSMRYITKTVNRHVITASILFADEDTLSFAAVAGHLPCLVAAAHT